MITTKLGLAAGFARGTVAVPAHGIAHDSGILSKAIQEQALGLTDAIGGIVDSEEEVR